MGNKLEPQLLVRLGPDKRCHSFIKDGKMQFLADSTHELSGKTVELFDVEPEE